VSHKGREYEAENNKSFATGVRSSPKLNASLVQQAKIKSMSRKDKNNSKKLNRIQEARG
jgi:hypothetical protein